MSKSSIALIDQQVSALVAGSAFEVTTTHVAGFPIPAAFSPNSEWSMALDDYEQRRGEITAKLDMVGVKPLAILPNKMWQDICRSNGLYILHPDGEGRVGVNVSKEVGKIEQKIARIVPMTLGFLTAVLFVQIWFSADKVASKSFFLFALSVLGMYTYYGLWRVVRKMFPETSRSIGARTLATLHAMFLGEIRIMQRMLDTGLRSSTKVKVKLPIPPQDVAETLSKLVGFQNMYVAVEPGAVKFAETPITLLATALAEKWGADEVEERRQKQEEALRQARMRALDPIIAVEHRGVVAIVAQFGDFPIEERVVKRAMTIENLRLT